MNWSFQGSIVKTDRIQGLIDDLFKKMPEIEADRAVLLTESYQETEGEPMVTRRAKAFAHILRNIPITIRDNELIVGSASKAPGAARRFRSIPISGWRMNWIRWQPEAPTRFIFLKKIKKSCAAYTGTGREKPTASLLPNIWRPRQGLRSSITFLL